MDPERHAPVHRSSSIIHIRRFTIWVAGEARARLSVFRVFSAVRSPGAIMLSTSSVSIAR
jgi:hypothetical protein